MPTRSEILKLDTPLTRAMPGAQFAECHQRIIPAERELVWQRFHQLTWSDLRVTKPLILLRGMSAAGETLVGAGPLATLTQDPPSYHLSANIARPWQLRPDVGPPVVSLAQFTEFGDPDWLKFASDFHFVALDAGRTLVRTVTLCEATSDTARRRFGPYWALIRGGSGLIRRDLLAALERRCRA